MVDRPFTKSCREARPGLPGDGVWLIVLILWIGASPRESLHAAPDGGGAVDSRDLKANLDLPYDALGYEDDEEDAPGVISFFGGRHEGEAILFCLDQSNSMATAGGWTALQRELGRAIQEMTEEQEFGLVFFGKKTVIFPPEKKAVKATRKNVQAALAFIAGIQPDSWTCMLPGVEQVLDLARTASAERKTVIVLSDGKPTCEGVNFFSYAEEILTAARTRNTEKVRIDTVGMGLEINASFLIQLATQHGGTYRFARP